MGRPTSSRMAIQALSAVEASLSSAGVMIRSTEIRGVAFFADRCVTSVVTTEVDVLIETILNSCCRTAVHLEDGDFDLLKPSERLLVSVVQTKMVRIQIECVVDEIHRLRDIVPLEFLPLEPYEIFVL